MCPFRGILKSLVASINIITIGSLGFDNIDLEFIGLGKKKWKNLKLGFCCSTEAGVLVCGTRRAVGLCGRGRRSGYGRRDRPPGDDRRGRLLHYFRRASGEPARGVLA